MKNKINKILGVALSLAMLTSLLVVGGPVKAGTLSYTTEALPGTSITTSVTQTTSISSYAVAGDKSTIYAVNGSTSVFKSTNGGSSWSKVDTSLSTGAGAGSSWQFVAVAPDDPNFVAIASTNATGPFVFVSSNGGATGGDDSWAATGAVTNGVTSITAASVSGLAVSPSVSGSKQVAVSGTLNTGTAGVYSRSLGGIGAGWTDVSAFVGFLANFDKTFALAFSSNYASDRTLVAVTNNSTSGNVTLQLARFATTTTGQWNASTGLYLDYDGTTISRGLIVVATGPIVTAKISLAPTYSGADSTTQIAFIAIDDGVGGAGSGVFRTIGAVRKEITDGSLSPFTSVAFNGTNLVAGRADNNATYYSSNPLVSTPDLTATVQFQRPSGGVGAVANMVKVNWVGTNVVAATTGNEGAFSRSGDNGVTFNDVSFIKTSVTKILDIAVAADGSKWYMVTSDSAGAGDVSFWSKDGTTWERLFSIVAPATTTFTIRIAPEDKNTVYLVNNGTPTIWYSNDGGNKTWQTRIANEAIADLAVESAQVIYYASGLNVRKSTNAGFLFNDPAVAALTSGNPVTVRSLAKDILFVTNDAGTVAYSTNGGTTFTRLILSGGGAMQATATTFATNDFVYAVPGAGNTLTQPFLGVFRWKIGSTGADAVWKAITPSTLANAVTTVGTGIVLKGGVLYVHVHDPAGVGGSVNSTAGSTLWRSLNPDAAGETSVTFSALPRDLASAPLSPVAAGPDFTVQGGRTSNLQISTASGVNTIWGIDNDAVTSEEPGDSTVSANDEIYSLTDTLSATGPTATAPDDLAVVGVNPVSGSTLNVVFSWNRPSLATDYTVQIATDKNFTQITNTVTFGQVIGTVGFDPAVSPVSTTLLQNVFGVNLNPDTTYYWRVRSIFPLVSPYSATRSFSVGSLIPFALKDPVVGAVNVPIKPILSWTAYKGALWYELTVSEDPTFAIPEFSHNVGAGVTPPTTFYAVTESLKNSTTYYWRVRGVTAEPFVKGTKVVTPAGPWMTGAFTTVAVAAPAAAPTVIVQKEPAPPPQIVQVPVEKQVIVQQQIPQWTLVTIIVIGAVLIIALIVLIVRTRKVA